METSSYGSAQHQWNSDRPDLEFIIAGQSIKGPDRNRIVLKNLKLYDSTDVTYIRDSFETSYKKLSEEEYQQLLLNIEKNYENDAAGLERAKGFRSEESSVGKEGRRGWETREREEREEA